MAQVPGNVFGRHPLEVELQATGQHGHWQLLGIRGRQQEFDVFRGFFKGLEESVKGLVGQHMYLVNEVHLEAATGWRVLDVIGEFPHIIHASTGGCVDFDQINKPPFLDFLATGAGSTRRGGNAGFAVQASGQQSANGCFAYAPGTGKQIGVVQPLVVQGVDQCLEHMLLADHIFECPGAPLTGKYLVAHVLPTAVKNGFNHSTVRMLEEANKKQSERDNRGR